MLSKLLKYKLGRESGKLFVLFSSLALAACMPEYGELDTNTAEKYDVQQCVATQAEARNLIEEQVLQGGTLYQQQCASCHGANNEGTNIASTLIIGENFNGFINATVERMPMADPAICDAECAAKIALFLSPEDVQNISQCDEQEDGSSDEVDNETPETPDSNLTGWSGQQVSNNEASNTSSLSIDDETGIFSVTASGGDIWDTADSFYFANKIIEGNASISLQVLSFDNTTGWSKTGVMIRDGLEENAKHASLFLTGGEANGLAFQWREGNGAATNFNPGNNSSPINAPIWLRLARNDSQLSAYQSTDGANWMEVASTNIDMNNQIYIGLATSPHPSNENASVNVRFSNVNINSDVTTEPTPEEPTPEEPTPEEPTPEETCNAITGKDFWEQTTCANCHGKTNQGGIANATNLDRLVAEELMENLTDVAGLAKFINDSMPSDPTMCVGDAPGSCAYDTATYIFSLQNETQECETEDGVALVITQKPLSNVLYKASMSLAGRLPTDQELLSVEENGLTGLDSVLGNFMDENAFYDRLKEIYNDMMLLGPKDADQDGYDKEWYKNFTDDESKYAKTLSYGAFNDEVFLLMRYVVENDRPFTEFLTADYTVVNPYSAHTFGVYDDLSFKKWAGSEYQIKIY